MLGQFLKSQRHYGGKKRFLWQSLSCQVSQLEFWKLWCFFSFIAICNYHYTTK